MTAEFKPTDAMREQVAIAAGSGRMTQEEIAIALGISPPTLRKHFERELAEGAYAKRLEALQALHAAAAKGNVSAIREYLEESPRIAVPSSLDAPEVPAAEGPKGKKERAQADAKTAQVGTGWDGLLPGPTTPQ